jgi:hypothetical protein
VSNIQSVPPETQPPGWKNSSAGAGERDSSGGWKM